MKITTFNNKDSFIESAVSYMSSVCDGKEVYISLCGGSTPGPVYEGLSDSNVDLAKTVFFQGDERYISRDDKLSNYRLISNSLLKNESKEIGGFNFFDTGLEKKECLEDYTNKLKTIPEQQFDLTILGIGPDGHIASVFPNSPALDKYDDLCVDTYTDAFDVRDRLSISVKMILDSKKILVLLRGQNKLPIINELKKGDKLYNDFPAALLKKHSNVEVFHLEK